MMVGEKQKNTKGESEKEESHESDKNTSTPQTQGKTPKKT